MFYAKQLPLRNEHTIYIFLSMPARHEKDMGNSV